jgi:hypothetical protein
MIYANTCTKLCCIPVKSMSRCKRATPNPPLCMHLAVIWWLTVRLVNQAGFISTSLRIAALERIVEASEIAVWASGLRQWLFQQHLHNRAFTKEAVVWHIVHWRCARTVKIEGQRGGRGMCDLYHRVYLKCSCPNLFVVCLQQTVKVIHYPPWTYRNGFVFNRRQCAYAYAHRRCIRGICTSVDMYVCCTATFRPSYC